MQYSLEPLNITKELILSRISEEQIFEHYGVKIKKAYFVQSYEKTIIQQLLFIEIKAIV
jgi:hypothetical protein